MIRAALLTACLAGSPALATDRVAVPDLDFRDTSGEASDQAAKHAGQLALFAETLRAGLGEGGVEAVAPACDRRCSPVVTPFEEMAAATRAAGTHLMLVGGLHKISTLIGTIRLKLIDLDADRVVCERMLSYRGDDAQAWARAAEFAAEDVLSACFSNVSS